MSEVDTERRAEIKCELNTWRAEEKVIAQIISHDPDMAKHTKEELLQILADKEHDRKVIQDMKDSMRKATVQDYDEWLMGFLEQGGKPTHYYDYAFPRFWVAERDFGDVSLFGSGCRYIIMPVGITVENWANSKHNIYYFMDGYTTSRNWVPVYADTLGGEDDPGPAAP